MTAFMANLKYSKKINKNAIRKALIEKYGPNCFYCGTEFQYLEDISVDHLIPQVKGGSNEMENLRPACFYCNNKKWSYSIDLWRQLVNEEIEILETKLNQLKKIAKTIKDYEN